VEQAEWDQLVSQARQGLEAEQVGLAEQGVLEEREVLEGLVVLVLPGLLARQVEQVVWVQLDSQVRLVQGEGLEGLGVREQREHPAPQERQAGQEGWEAQAGSALRVSRVRLDLEEVLVEPEGLEGSAALVGLELLGRLGRQAELVEPEVQVAWAPLV
jgi:hypothetical protein